MRKHDKHGAFFTIDAIVALTVLAIGIIFLFITFTGEPIREQTSLYTADLMKFFSNTAVKDIQDVDIINLWCSEGALCTRPTHDIKHPEQSLLSALTQLAHEGRVDFMQSIATNLSESLVQRQFGWNLTIEMQDGSEQLVTNQSQPFLREVTNVIATKTLIYYVTEEHQLRGPYVAKVHVWE